MLVLCGVIDNKCFAYFQLKYFGTPQSFFRDINALSLSILVLR